MELIPIKSSKELWNLYSEDKKTHVTDFKGDPIKGLTSFKAHACVTPLIIVIGDKKIVTNEWFITQVNNELIYDIENNNWVNMDMFNEGDSVCQEIYYMF